MRARERSSWREREYRGRECVQEDAGLIVRRGGRRRGSRVTGIADARDSRRGSRVAQMLQTRGSRPAFKSGREENADASLDSASRQYE